MCRIARLICSLEFVRTVLESIDLDRVGDEHRFEQFGDW